MNKFFFFEVAQFLHAATIAQEGLRALEFAYAVQHIASSNVSMKVFLIRSSPSLVSRSPYAMVLEPPDYNNRMKRNK